MVVRRFAAVSCDYEIACSCEDEEASALCCISDLIDRDDFDWLSCILVIFIDMERCGAVIVIRFIGAYEKKFGNAVSVQIDVIAEALAVDLFGLPDSSFLSAEEVKIRLARFLIEIRNLAGTFRS